MLKKGLLVCLITTVLGALAAPAHAEQKLAWNGREINGWVCDGRELKPKFGANMQNTWIFDGREIRPKTGANFGNTWIFDGRELKPKTGANFQNTWIIEGNKARPKTGANFKNTWNVGTAPILVIAGALVLHLY